MAGTAFAINGTNLTGATGLSLNNTAITGFVVNSAGNQITANIPAGATTGTFSVTTPLGNASSTGSFTVQQPHAGRIVLDGYRETRYGTAAALQTVPTQFGNSATGTQNSAGGGSELDAAYTYVHGDSLYVLLSGNIENNGNSVDIFFDSQAGGQNVLTNTNPNVDNNGLNAMSGLQFDTGFTADYFLSLKGAQGGGIVDAYFASLGAIGTGVTAANATTRTTTLTLPGGRTGQLGVDQSNTGGVDGSNVYAGAPAAVVTGLEFVIPLAAIGSPTTALNIMAFVNGGGHGYLSNQVLAGLPTGTGNLAGPNINFTTYAGNQYFTASLPTGLATVTGISPGNGPVGTSVIISGTNFLGTSAVSFNGTAASGFVVNAAGTAITVTVPTGATTGNLTITNATGPTTSTIAFTVTAAPTLASISPATGVAGTSVTLTGANLTGTTAVTLGSVAAPGFVVNAAGTAITVAVPVGATSGTFQVTNSLGSASSSSFTVLQPTAGRIVLDGYRESRYGAAAALQTTPTQFGNSTTGTPAGAGGGSELDGAYTYIHGDSLYVFLAGNIENNGNSVDIFFDSQTGGQNVLTNTNPNVDNNGLNAMSGLTFDTGFTADYFLSLKGNNTGGVVDAYFASLGATGTGVTAANATTRTATLTLPGGRTGQLAIDQSNTGGIDANIASAGLSSAVVTGLEFVIPLAAIGSPTGTVNISAFVNGGSHGYLSNQILAGLPFGTNNLTGPSTVNFNIYAGNQYFTVTVPAAVATVTAVSPVSGAVGTSVTITGTNLTGTTAVSFNGTAAPGFVVNAAGTSITVAVPTGATAGAITVTTPTGAITSTGGFCVQYAPTVTNSSNCGPGTVTLTAGGAPTGGSFAFYSGPTGGTALTGTTGNSFTTPSLTATTTYYVGITTGTGATACEGPRTAITATINTAAVATAGADRNTCSGVASQLGAAAVANQTYSWSPATGLSDPTVANPTVTLTNTGATSTTTTYTLTATTTAAGACTATSQVTVTVNPTPATPTITASPIANNTVVLTSSAPTGNQWYRGGVLVSGATGQTYTVSNSSLNGTYTVITTSAAGCPSAASAGQSAIVLGTANAALTAQIQVYPNPTQGRFTLSLPGTYAAQVQVLNALGQTVQTRSTTGSADLDLTGLARGVYAVRVQLGADVVTKRIVLE